MHAAVWSQPIARSKLRRSQAQSETPHTSAGKSVLGVGITLVLIGGLLVVLGITGYFVRGGHKYFLGFGAPAGGLTLFAGLAGCRVVTRRDKIKKYTSAFGIFGFLAVAANITMGVLAGMVLQKDNLLLLTQVISVGEVVASGIVSFLTILGVVVAVCCQQIISQDSPEDSPNTKDLHPPLPLQSTDSPDTPLTLITDIDRVRL